MKPVSDTIACVVDHGLFLPLALRLAEDFKHVFYFSPFEEGFSHIAKGCIGDGFEDRNLERVSGVFEAKRKGADVFVFPDIEHSDLQVELRSQGIPVWGSGTGDSIELNREKFARILKETGLEVFPHTVVVGVEALREHLRDVEDKFIKISRWRGDCFDEQTEILTDTGWKRFESLTEQDKVATADMETRCLEFKTPSAYIKRWHDGEMLHFSSKSLDALVTPTHCFWSKSGEEMPRWKYRPAFEVANYYSLHIPRYLKWEGKYLPDFTVPGVQCANRGISKPRLICSRDWFSFLGWFVSEGCVNLTGPNKDKYRITISQSKAANPSKYEEIEKLIDAMGYNAQREGENGFSIYDKALFMELEKTCYDSVTCNLDNYKHCSHRKRIPRYVLDSTPEQIGWFLESYEKGDGSRAKDYVRFYTVSIGLAGDVQEAVFKTGKCATIAERDESKPHNNKNGVPFRDSGPSYAVSMFDRHKDISLYTKKSCKKVHYSGWVYDVEVNPHHSIFVRRNGKAFWSGNCETTHWRNYRSDASLLDQWSLKFGPLPMRFLVCDSIETDLEIGGDTYSVLGQWPSLMLNGLEWKDSAYLSAVTKREDMPEQIQEVMEALSPVFKAHGVANEFSSEIRIEKDTGKAYFTDPTMRGGLPSTGSQLMAWKNISEIVLAGAHGELVDPVPDCQYTVETILKVKSNRKGWECFELTEDLIPHAKIASCCFHDGQYCIPPDDEGEKAIGWLVATGNTPAETLENLKELAEELPDGLTADVESLAHIIEEIESAEKEGIEFGNTAHPLPEPAAVLES